MPDTLSGMTFGRSIAYSVGLLVLAGCGGNGNPPTTPPPVPQTSTLTGTASTSDAGGCSSPGHTLATGTGSISLTVTQASAARIKLQVCHVAQTDHTQCTVPPFASLAVGESLTATLKGGRDQVVTIYPDACGSPGNPPASTVTYTVSATYPGG